MGSDTYPLRVALVATPDAQVSPLSGLYETLTSFPLIARFENHVPPQPFDVQLVTATDASVACATGLTVEAHRTINEVDEADVVIVPLMTVQGPDWKKGRYPRLVSWLRRQHAKGSVLCSACTGVLLLAETGLLDGCDATIHWAFANTFRRNFPGVNLRTDEVLIATGERRQFVMTGGVMSWHDLALHLIGRYVGPTAAQSVARFLMLEWHGSGQAPFVSFHPPTTHGDAVVSHLQRWLEKHFAAPAPVDQMVQASGLTRRSLERRFRAATGHTPLAYVQQLRMAEARRLLERTSKSVDEIAYAVGYENTAFFRRLFRRCSRITPSAYRRRFGVIGVRL